VLTALITSTKLLYAEAVSIQMGDRSHVTSHSGQLSLLPLTGQEMSSDQGTVAVLCGLEGNHRSCIELVMHHTLWYIHRQAQWPKTIVQQLDAPSTLIPALCWAVLKPCNSPCWFFVLRTLYYSAVVHYSWLFRCDCL